MIEPEFPPHERARLESLRGLSILDTPSEERFDRITRLACRVFGVPISLVSLVDDKRQWFKSCQGLAAAETPRTISFCGHSILAPDALVVCDALEDLRFRDNPLVTGEPRIRFYAGQPVSGPQGHRLGTLCIIDRKPRLFSGEDLDRLRDLGTLVEDEFERAGANAVQNRLLAERDQLKRQARIDPLTRCWNRHGILELLELECSQTDRCAQPLAVALLDIDNFKQVNDSLGHAGGDALLMEVVRCAKTAVRPYDAVGRYGGDEFLLIFPGADAVGAMTVCERVRSRIAALPTSLRGGSGKVTVSLGVASLPSGGVRVPGILVAAADAALLAAKRGGRDRVR